MDDHRAPFFLAFGKEPTQLDEALVWHDAGLGKKILRAKLQHQ